MSKVKVAVVGSGISGLSAAYQLSKNPKADVTLIEASSKLGGHSYTYDMSTPEGALPIDMGFLVHNDRTYPKLIQLFEELEIKTHPSEMSFSVHLEDIGLEWSGCNLYTVFSQKRNLLRPQFHRMLLDILKFNKHARRYLILVQNNKWSLKDLLSHEKYSESFINWYLIPMGAAIWSTPADQMLNFPAETFIRFSINHGLLQVSDRPQWKTVAGGSRVYVEKMARHIHNVQKNNPVISLHQADDSLALQTHHGLQKYDHVVFACHSDQALRIARSLISDKAANILSNIHYSDNTAHLHTDPSFLPKSKTTWAAWIYARATGGAQKQPVSITYLINMLQPLPMKRPIIVTLNPHKKIDQSKILHSVEFTHPVFDQNAIDAQKELPTVQGDQNIWFCGAWTRYGFHEDGCMSGLNIGERLSAHIDSQMVNQPNELVVSL
ncbi:MAG: FAD-dependent oxidoreductase [Bdellovibrionota bacterium]